MEHSQTAGSGKHLKEPPRRKKRNKAKWAIVLVIAAVAIAVLLARGLLNVHNNSIYRMIVQDGYTGSQEQWLASLVGEEVDTDKGKTAYELACENGYSASESKWIETLTGVVTDEVQKSPYATACENGFQGTLSEWLTEIADKPDKLGKSGRNEKKTEYEYACEYGYTGSFIEWLVSVTQDRVF